MTSSSLALLEFLSLIIILFTFLIAFIYFDFSDPFYFYKLKHKITKSDIKTARQQTILSLPLIFAIPFFAIITKSSQIDSFLFPLVGIYIIFYSLFFFKKGLFPLGLFSGYWKNHTLAYFNFTLLLIAGLMMLFFWVAGLLNLLS